MQLNSIHKLKTSTRRLLGMIVRLLVILVVTTLFSGCTKNRDILFEVPVRLEFEIPAGLNPFDKHFQIIEDVPTNFEIIRKQFNVPDDQEITIRPGTAILTSTTGDVNFDFIEEFGIFLFKEDREDEIDAFLTDQVPFNAGRNVLILPFDTDLTELVSQDKINFKIAFRLRATTPSFIQMAIEVVFTVE